MITMVILEQQFSSSTITKPGTPIFWIDRKSQELHIGSSFTAKQGTTKAVGSLQWLDYD